MTRHNSFRDGRRNKSTILKWDNNLLLQVALALMVEEGTQTWADHKEALLEEKEFSSRLLQSQRLKRREKPERKRKPKKHSKCFLKKSL
jgi:hypothetical protein